MNKKYIFIFIAIVIIAAVLRFIELDKVPPGLNQDEAAAGVDAYYLGIWGKDHHGNKPGVALETYGDWVSPLQTYLAVPVVKILGLTEYTARSSAAFWGVITIIISMLFTLELGRRFIKNKSYAYLFSVATGLFLTISPWHIMMVRWALPSGLVPLCMLIITWFAFKSYFALQEGKSSRWVYGLLASIFAGISIYAYPTMKLFLPIYYGLLLLIFFVLDFKRKGFWKAIWVNIKMKYLFLLLVGLVFVAIAFPLFWITTKNPEKYQFRYDEVSIWGKEDNAYMLLGTNYISYLSNSFFFNIGDTDPMRMIPMNGALGYGLFIPYYFGLFLIILGAFKNSWLNKVNFIDSEKFQIVSIILLTWLLVAPIPASLTVDRLHSFRVIQLLPALIIVSAIGFTTVISLISYYIDSKWLKLFALVLVLFPIIENIGVFSYAYYGNTYREYVYKNFQYGLKDVFDYTESYSYKYDKIIVDRNINNPYIYVLFYTQPDLNSTKVDITRPEKGGWNDAKQVGKYFFEEVSINNSSDSQSDLPSKYDLCSKNEEISGGSNVRFGMYDCPDKTLVVDKVDR